VTLIDDAGEVTVSVTIGPAARFDLDNPWPEMVGAFPGGPEAVRVGALRGRLRHRSREKDGGAYDGWWLSACSPERCLGVLVTDQGKDRERWQHWRGNALSVEWRDIPVDTELALGASAGRIVGMHLDSGVAGGLGYKADSGEDVDLTVKAAPLTGPALTPEVCATVARKAYRNVEPARDVSGAKVRGCEVDSADETRSIYTALVRPRDDSGTLMVMGTAPTSSFRTWRPRFAAAVHALRWTR
jgi:hypothetical protein